MTYRAEYEDHVEHLAPESRPWQVVTVTAGAHGETTELICDGMSMEWAEQVAAALRAHEATE